MTTATPDACLSIRGLGKTFDLTHGPVRALDGIDLAVPPGSFTCIVGTSGCGKSTLLRIIAGLEGDFTGQVSLAGRPISGPGRDRGVVFQEHRLLPWLTVEQNVAFALNGLQKDQADDLVRQHLDLVGLGAFAKAHPGQLSGGMAQRVAIARALVNHPQILLLDEPFGALDAMTRIVMQQEILRIREAGNITMILVTHDIDEAIFLGDQVVTMSARPGRITSVLPVSLPRPRDRSSPHFIALRKHIFGTFFAETEQAFAYAI
jgi:sulfonate transport system ATP-binding protein